VLPINAILMTLLKQGRLCLTVSWVVEFLKMMNWSSLLRLTNFQPYSDTFHLLHCLQLQVASWITYDTNLSFPRLSSNRLYYAMEIQNIFSQYKYDFSAERTASPGCDELVENISMISSSYNSCILPPLHILIQSILSRKKFWMLKA
jgi:hypothetical protein